MKVEIQGHVYHLQNFEDVEGTQEIMFVHKEPITEGSTELKTAHDGTTNEEVLKMLINRMYFLQGKMLSRENSIVITKLEECLMWLEKRTADRQIRGVEGTFVK